jgi:hypothetical protein
MRRPGAVLDEVSRQQGEWEEEQAEDEVADKAVVRAFEAGPDGLDIIAVGGPKPEEGDGVRATATWPGTE